MPAMLLEALTFTVFIQLLDDVFPFQSVPKNPDPLQEGYLGNNFRRLNPHLITE